MAAVMQPRPRMQPLSDACYTTAALELLQDSGEDFDSTQVVVFALTTLQSTTKVIALHFGMRVT